jgi:NAD(P)-dependent dehydrogenase (short-subunit alcohol dehydrogenase family)
MSSSLTGKTAVITGAGSGIGRAAALLFANEGARVHVADRDAERVAAVVAEIGDAATGHTVDVTDPAAVETLADAAFGGGRVDIVMNNAGIGHAGRTADTPLEDWRAIVEVNIMGVVHGVHAFVPPLLAQGGRADIVNTASMAGLVPVATMAPYVMSKHAIVGLSGALHAELSSQGIRVTALCPGVIDTAIVAESTMRGDMAAVAPKAVDFYRRRGASPDVVARDVLRTITRRHRVITTSPRWQVMPAWIVQRISVRAGQFYARNATRIFSP